MNCRKNLLLTTTFFIMPCMGMDRVQQPALEYTSAKEFSEQYGIGTFNIFQQLPDVPMGDIPNLFAKEITKYVVRLKKACVSQSEKEHNELISCTFLKSKIQYAALNIWLELHNYTVFEVDQWYTLHDSKLVHKILNFLPDSQFANLQFVPCACDGNPGCMHEGMYNNMRGLQNKMCAHVQAYTSVGLPNDERTQHGDRQIPECFRWARWAHRREDSTEQPKYLPATVAVFGEYSNGVGVYLNNFTVAHMNDQTCKGFAINFCPAIRTEGATLNVKNKNCNVLYVQKYFSNEDMPWMHFVPKRLGVQGQIDKGVLAEFQKTTAVLIDPAQMMEIIEHTRFIIKKCNVQDGSSSILKVLANFPRSESSIALHALAGRYSYSDIQRLVALVGSNQPACIMYLTELLITLQHKADRFPLEFLKNLLHDFSVLRDPIPTSDRANPFMFTIL
jgi:hypothetical protein